MFLWERFKEWQRQLRSQWSSDPLQRCQWIKFPSIRQSLSNRPKDQLARAGEEAAANFLIGKGYSILHRNVRFPEGELDIVAQWKNILVFIEVKTRKTETFGQPYLFVTTKKQRRQVVLAEKFISICRLHAVPVRFDVISVVLPSGVPPRIEHIEDAFRSNDL